MPYTAVEIAAMQTDQSAVTSAQAKVTADIAAGGSSSVLRLAFYYPWFPNAWNQQGFDPFSHYQPTLGYYSSSNPAVLANHVAALLYGNMDAGIISWWGQGSQEDTVVPLALAAAHGTSFQWTLYYEAQGIGDPDVAQIESDLAYIKEHYASDPNFLHIDGKPALFVYAQSSDACPMATTWSTANGTEDFFVVLKVFPNYATCPNQPEGWHQYGPASAIDHQVGFSFTISPGYWKRTDATPLLVRNSTIWAQSIQAMVASGERFQLVTTYNEWGEGTAVESGTLWESASGFGIYLDALHELIPSGTALASLQNDQRAAVAAAAKVTKDIAGLRP
jgi:hypothetical protein